MNTRDDQSELFPIVDQYVTASEVERVLREALELAKKGARHE